METKTRLVLKYIDGRYLSWDVSNYPLTPKISQARRFYDINQTVDFLQNSHYKPELYGYDPSEFEVVEVQITYREVEIDV